VPRAVTVLLGATQAGKTTLMRVMAGLDARVNELAAKLHIEPFLRRLPAELSGGQQQRAALARALAKNAPLMLLDEPLVNLDYKLREELRDELSQLFANGQSTVVYATTEPTEALLLGGHTAVMDADGGFFTSVDAVRRKLLSGMRTSTTQCAPPSPSANHKINDLESPEARREP
jgi:ABC-type sugar transport system ATPase subunit